MLQKWLYWDKILLYLKKESVTMNKKKNNPIGSMSLAALLSALSSTFIILGTALDILDITVCAICSVIVAISVIELGNRYSVLVYATSCVLSFFFITISSAWLYYVGFFGYYPILKKAMQKLPKWASKIISFALFNVAMVAIWFIFANLFLSADDTVGLYIALLVMGNIFFFAFDYVLDMFHIIYKHKLSKIFKSRK